MKIKYLFQQLLMLLFLTVLLFGCKKENLSKVNQPNGGVILYSIENSTTDPSIKEDGIFFFQSNVINNDNSLKNVLSLAGLFYDKSGNEQPGGGVVSIGNAQLTPDTAGFYGLPTFPSTNDFCGKTIVFRLTPPLYNPPGVFATVTDSLYSPAAIYITSVPARAPLTIKEGTSTSITWNVDRNNHNGIVIMAEYMPTLPANTIALSNGYKTWLSNIMVLPDNGSTLLPWSFFNGFPKNAQLTLWVARGNFKLIKNGSYNYKVGGYTASAVWNTTLE